MKLLIVFALFAAILFSPPLTPPLRATEIIAASFWSASTDFSGDWIGTYTGLPLFSEPTGSQDLSDAQSMATGSTWNDLSLTVQIADPNPAVIDYAIETDSDGSPSGTIIATSTMDLQGTGQEVPDYYTFIFPSSVSLTPGNYWIVATSPTSEPSDGNFQHLLPVWVASTYAPYAGDDTIEVQSNGGPWFEEPDQAFAFELDGNLVSGPGSTIPEPRWGVIGLGGLGLVAFAALRCASRDSAASGF